MYSKEETRQLNQDFWESFHNYTLYYSKQVSEPIDWMLYKTKIKGLELKFEVEPKWIAVVLEINHKNEERRLNYFSELEKYRNLIDEGFEARLNWEETFRLKEGKNVSRVYIGITEYNFHSRDHWKEIFHFMATNMYRLQSNLKELLPILEETLR
jgi:hypothetical protein